MFRDLVKRRAQGEPVAYIVGRKEFYGREFVVDRRVLVPRPETELLIDAVKRHVAANATEAAALRIVDVGTGSGTIAVTLAAEPRATHPELVVVGVDLSPDALAVALDNATRHDVRDVVKLVTGDATAPLKTPQSVDVLVSNPPYLDDALMSTLPRDVRDFEPELALYGGTDGMDVLRRLVRDGPRVLRNGGLLALEGASDAQMAALCELIRSLGVYEEPRVVRDYAHIGRLVTARLLA